MSRKIEKLLKKKQQDIAVYLAEGYTVKIYSGIKGKMHLVAYEGPGDNGWIEESWK